jgi:AraC-like DNA-binding protein
MAGEGMRYFRLRPDTRLGPWIKCYWWVEPEPGSKCALADSPDPPDLLIPDGHSELVFRFAGAFTRWQLDEPARREHMRKSYVIGGRSKSVLTHSPGGLRLAGVKLDPRALRALLRRPLTDLRDNTVDCVDLACPALLELEDEIANLKSVDQLPAVFDRFFLRRLTGIEDARAIERLLGKIRATRGTQPILKFAREHRLDVRTLERQFIACMGMTPKQFARVERFKHSYRQLSAHMPGGRREHLEPYYDESHFDREFRHFMGMSPMSWFNQAPDFTTVIGDHLLEGELQHSH